MQTLTEKQTMKLPSHLFVSSTDGHLYDTRKTDWSKAEPLRKNYRYAHREIATVADLKATMRVKYAWPGGYEIVYATNDGATLCDKCVRENFRSIVDDIKQPLGSGSGWRVVASTYEAVSADCAREVSEDLLSYCDQCGKEFGELA